MLSSLVKKSIQCIRPIGVLNRSIIWNQNIAENTNSIDITFCFANGDQRKVKGRIGDSLKDTANAFHLPIPGDCNGTSLPRKVFKMEHYTKDVFQQEKNCDFCHVILDDGVMDKVQKPEVGEQLWLDKFLVNPNKNSRLACQIQVTKDLDGTTVFVPEKLH